MTDWPNSRRNTASKKKYATTLVAVKKIYINKETITEYPIFGKFWSADPDVTYSPTILIFLSKPWMSISKEHSRQKCSH
jgi:hypothetical protein